LPSKNSKQAIVGRAHLGFVFFVVFVAICSFGLSRMLGSDKTYYRTNDRTMPVKWTAPEALRVRINHFFFFIILLSDLILTFPRFFPKINRSVWNLYFQE
jgi:hypothetical protein